MIVHILLRYDVGETYVERCFLSPTIAKQECQKANKEMLGPYYIVSIEVE